VDNVRPGADRSKSPAAARSGDLASKVVRDVQRLVGLEIALAKQELKDLALTNAIAAAMALAGGLLVVLAVLVAVPAVIVTIVPWHWQAAGAWVIVYALTGIGLALTGRARFRVRMPDRTLASLKESREWALRRMRSTFR
jgi:hypothetical protein